MRLSPKLIAAALAAVFVSGIAWAQLIDPGIDGDTKFDSIRGNVRDQGSKAAGLILLTGGTNILSIGTNLATK